MTERPMIFSAPMVRAILARRKTQTRRVLKPQPPTNQQFFGSTFSLVPAVADGVKMYSQNDYERLPKHPTRWELCGSVGVARDAGYPKTYDVRYAPGDTLWVREAFIGARGYDALPPRDFGNKPIWYCADGEPDREKWWHLSDRKRPSIHMPRWAARITLRVTGVRVQRLQDISEEDARAEGATPRLNCYGYKRQSPGWSMDWSQCSEPHDCALGTPRMAFANYWNHLHVAGAWDANPWVVVVGFEVRP